MSDEATCRKMIEPREVWALTVLYSVGQLRIGSEETKGIEI